MFAASQERSTENHEARSHFEPDGILEMRLERIARLAKSALKSTFAAVCMSDAEYHPSASIPNRELMEVEYAISQRGDQIIEADPITIPDARVDLRFNSNQTISSATEPKFFAGYPIQSSRGRKIGTLCIVDNRPRHLPPDEDQALRDLAVVAAMEIATQKLTVVNQELLSEVKKVRRSAQIDSLTRTWNRESIFNLLNAELARALRYGTGAGLIVVDIDHFKRINDTLGHAAGDQVLYQVAQRIHASVRAVDSVGRFGGEEFLIALGPCNGKAGAAVVAERILKHIGEQPISSPTGAIKVTASLGVAFFDQATGLTGQTLFECADAALYRAKHNGRNRVEYAVEENEYGSLRKAS